MTRKRSRSTNNKTFRTAFKKDGGKERGDRERERHLKIKEFVLLRKKVQQCTRSSEGVQRQIDLTKGIKERHTHRASNSAKFGPI